MSVTNGGIDRQSYWLERLVEGPIEPPYARASVAPAGTRLGPVVATAGTSEGQVIAAFALWLSRLKGAARFSLGFCSPETARGRRGDEGFSARLPLVCAPGAGASFAEAAAEIERDLRTAIELAPDAGELMARLPELTEPRYRCAVTVLEPGAAFQPSSAELELVLGRGPATARLAFDPDAFDEATAARIAHQLGTFIAAAAHDPARPVAALPLVDEEERRALVELLNSTETPFDRGACVHDLISRQAARTPEAVALVYEDRLVTYAALEQRANSLARRLVALGAGPDRLVGLCLGRSEELVIAALAILKAGAAYLPLDPAYPRERLALMIEDSGTALILCQGSTRALVAGGSAEVVDLETLGAELGEASPEAAPAAATSRNLAYAIYTSGSTGKPKGVLIEHRQVVNFFVGMDAHIEAAEGQTWLAVTSLSFDISVLELFWTLARGWKVVIAGDDRSALETKRPLAAAAGGGLDFSLFYFAADEEGDAAGKYRLLVEGARFADRNGFAAVWTPERHFAAFGGLYPNPAIAGAALAMVTERVQIRAGSCVAPLHHPARIAEEWAVVDNLSRGRVGISFAAGWHPNDFVLRPEAFADKKGEMARTIDLVRRLWRGEAVSFAGPLGPTAVSTRPRPIQPELPFWITAAGNPATFEEAGRMGANLLTHLLGQSLEEVEEKIALYRRAWQAAGHGGRGAVTLMLHTFVGDDEEAVKRTVREPMKRYLRSSVDLIGEHAASFPAFKRVAAAGGSLRENVGKLSEEELDALLEFSFERYYERSGLFGTAARCRAVLDRVRRMGVDEVACLVDFGVDPDTVLAHLPSLAALRESIARPQTLTADDFSLPAQIVRHEVSHLQCTPSMARMLLASPDARTALAEVRHLMLGGEPLPEALVRELRAATGARVSNMYGPTETTIWSAVDPVGDDGVTIGRPIANTQLYILDPKGELLPVGAAGELFIAGDGVARGYHDRPDLTDARFVQNPFVADGAARMYRTGDLVRYRVTGTDASGRATTDGRIEFLGRLDQQVKIRGFRIELGEIESLLEQHPSVREAVVVVREDRPGDVRLVAYLLTSGGSWDEAALRAHLGRQLPEYMVPGAFVRMERFPLTPNKKVDRKSLPPPSADPTGPTIVYEAPRGAVEEIVSGIYASVLGVERVGRDANFFEVGGHSLLAVQAHRKLREALGRELAITDLFRFPTVAGLCGFLDTGGAAAGDARLQQTSARASARREALTRRRVARDGGEPA